MSYHGLFSLGNVGPKIIIKNNLFVDAFALGEDPTDATRAAEWANTGEIYANGNNRITWIFTAPNQTTQWSVSNNYYAISDSGKAFLDKFKFGAGSPLSWHINSRLGADSTKAFTQTKLSLTKIPRLMTNMIRWYEDPLGANKTKGVTNFVSSRDDYDRRFIEFYRDTMNCAYATTLAAYTGAEGGFPVGDLNWFPTKKSAWLTDVKETFDAMPNAMALYQNYPNPFNPTTQIAFNLAKAGYATLSIYNILGQKVATPVANKLSAGRHEIRFDASNLANGVYFYKLESGNQVSQKKMLLIK
jgi:hypothetical protein